MSDTLILEENLPVPLHFLSEKALEKWGEDAQINQAIEEMAELTVALNHYRRGRKTKEDVAAEWADVLIMLSQLEVVIGREDTEIAFAFKYGRLAERLGHPIIES
jgi:NTP pyrophosphatase (non-canonical NTP hydrolase)